MDVKDGLPRFWSDVEHRTIAVFDAALASDFGRHQMKSADQFSALLLRFLQTPHVFLGDDEYVCGRLRIDVFEGECMFVFVNLLGRNLATDDFAE